MPVDPLTSRLELALAAAREAGEITLRYFRRDNLRVERKADASPVTEADRESEQHLRRRIAAAFPQDAILGEEFGEQPGSSGYRWILDPIDGTKSFIYGVPFYGQLIGIERDRRSLVGVINIPALDECVYAAAGQGAWYTRGSSAPSKAAVSKVPRLADSLLITSELEGYTATGRWDVLAKLAQSAWITRTWGDCYGYLLVATGRADAVVDPRMHVWDAAALQPILEEAGGTFTDWQGKPSIYTGNAVATNGLVAEEVLSITSATRSAETHNTCC